MDLWNRLFHSRRKQDSSNDSQSKEGKNSGGDEGDDDVAASQARDQQQSAFSARMPIQQQEKEKKTAALRTTGLSPSSYELLDLPPPPPPPSVHPVSCGSEREFELSRAGIRVLLYRDCKRRGRKLLYDSSTVVRVPSASLALTCSLPSHGGWTRGTAAPLTTAPNRGMTAGSCVARMCQYQGEGSSISTARGEASPSSLPPRPSSGRVASPQYVLPQSLVGRLSSKNTTAGDGSSLWPSSLSLSSRGPTATSSTSSSADSVGLTERGARTSSASLGHSRAPEHGGCVFTSGHRKATSYRENVVMETNDDFTYMYEPQSDDSAQLGQMVFGCVALSYRGSCTKMHSLTGPPRTMLSRTRPRPLPRREGGVALRDAGLGSSLGLLEQVYRASSSCGTNSRDVSFYLGSVGEASKERVNSNVSTSSGFRSSATSGGLRASFGSASRGDDGVLRRTSTTPSEDDSGFGGAGGASWLSSAGGSFLSPLVTPLGSVSSKSSMGSSSSGSLSNLQRRYLRRTADTSLDSLAAMADQHFSDVGAGGGVTVSGGEVTSQQYLQQRVPSYGSKSSSYHSVSSCSSTASSHNSPSVATTGSSSSSSNTLSVSASTVTSKDDRAASNPSSSSTSSALGSSSKQSIAEVSTNQRSSSYQTSLIPGNVAVYTPAATLQTRLGLAVVLQADQAELNTSSPASLQRWLLLHSPVLEEAVSRLQAALDNAYLRTHAFVSLAYRAVTSFQQEVLDLAYGPHLMSPLWLLSLNLPDDASSNGPPGSPPPPRDGSEGRLKARQVLCSSLVSSLQVLLAEHDTKQTNFFVSRLITGVLTYHLGWVTAVALAETAGEQQHQGSECGVQAQVLELYGGLGCPPHCCRTLLFGASSTLLHHALTLLSYLIRCQQVFEQDILESDSLELFIGDVAEKKSINLDPNNQDKSEYSSSKSVWEGSPPGLMEPAHSPLGVLKHSSSTLCTPSTPQPPSCSASETSLPKHFGGGYPHFEIKNTVSDGFSGSSTSSTCSTFNADPKLRVSRSLQADVTAPLHKNTITLATKTPGSRKDAATNTEPTNVSQKVNFDFFDLETDSKKSKTSAYVKAKSLLLDKEIVSPEEPSALSLAVNVTKETSVSGTPPLGVTNSFTTQPESRGLPSAAQDSLPKFKSSKTSHNLAALALSDMAGNSNICVDIISRNTEKSLPKVSNFTFSNEGTKQAADGSANIYPSLCDLDDHREVFGPKEFHPEIIAAKVRALCRVSPEKTNQESSSGSRCFISDNASKSSTSLVHTLHESLERTHDSIESDSATIGPLQATPYQVKVFGEDITLDVQDSKKVIFIVGEDDELDPPPRNGSTALSANPASFISCLPNRGDFREICESRHLGRSCALYPDLRSDNLIPEPMSFFRCASERKLRQEHCMGHKRASSDPFSKGRRSCGSSHVRAVTAGAEHVEESGPVNTTGRCVDRAVQTEQLAMKEEVVNVFHEDLEDEIFTVLATPVVETRSQQQRSPYGMAESLMGGVLDHYSPVFVLQAIVNTDASDDALRLVTSGSGIKVHSFQPSTETFGTSLFGGTRGSRSSSYAKNGCDGGGSRGRTMGGLKINNRGGSTSAASSGALSFASSFFNASPNRLFGMMGGRSSYLGPSMEGQHSTSGTSGSGTPTRVSFSVPGHERGFRRAGLDRGSVSCKQEVLAALRRDLDTDNRCSCFRANHVALVADMDDWGVTVMSGSGEGVSVGMSPLVASITDALQQLLQLGAPPDTIVQCMENKLTEVYYKSHILANYLLGGSSHPAAPPPEAAFNVLFSKNNYTGSSARHRYLYRTDDASSDRGGADEPGVWAKPKGISPGSLAALPTALGLDLNDLPLLLAIASTHSPQLASMYGLSIR